MNNASSKHTKKPSFFKTLPDTIASSPTGIPRISNSAFPSLNPSTQYKSVYERAGFDVNKTGHKPSSTKSPTTGQYGFRSQSASQLPHNPKVIDQKRNVSEYFSQQAANNMTASSFKNGKSPALNKAALTIDSNLANQSYRAAGNRPGRSQESLSSNSVPSTGILHQSSKLSNNDSSPVSQTNASTRLNAENVVRSQNHVLQSAKTPSSFNKLPTPQHSAFDIPLKKATSNHFTEDLYNSTAQTTRYSQQSELSQNSDQSSYQADQAASIYESAQSLPHTLNSYRSQISQRSDGTRTQPSSATSATFPTQQLQQKFEPSPLSNTFQAYDESTNVKPRGRPDSFSSTPLPFVDQSQDKVEPVEFDPDVSLQSGGSVKFTPEHPIYNEETTSSANGSRRCSLNPDDLDNQSISDTESLRSRVLSLLPKNQHFNFESIDQSNIISSPQRSELMSPPFMQRDQQIPTLTISDADKNGTPLDFESPKGPQPGAFRTSGMSATSVYSEVSTPLTDASTDFTSFNRRAKFSPGTPKQESTSPEHHNSSPVYKEIESQLENLTMDSTQYHNYPEPLQIQVHSVKEISTVQSFIGSGAASPRVDPVHQLETEIGAVEDGLGIDTTIKARTAETEESKYPPGEGPCRKCGLEIEDKPIYSRSGELSGQWHRQCFICTTCDLKFSKKTSCFVLDDLPYCEYHYHLKNNSLCKICGNGIVGKCLEDDATDRYHIECLRCTNCSKAIDSDYLSVNTKVFCESCARTITGLNRETTRVEKRRTKISVI